MRVSLSLEQERDNESMSLVFYTTYNIKSLTPYY